MKSPMYNWFSLVAGGLLLCAITCGQASCGRSPGAKYEPFYVLFDYYVLDYDRYEVTPVDIQLKVYFGNILEPIQIASARVSWGDDTGWEVVDLPMGPSGFFVATAGTSFDLSHTYVESGEYFIDVRMTTREGEELSRPFPLDLRIGPERRMFTDPRDGSTYEIYDGTVWVSFTDWERFAELDHEMALEPDIAAFLEAENLRVRQESVYTGSMEVILPGGGTTVEEAVAEWPERYPELIEAVDPNSISEPM